MLQVFGRVPHAPRFCSDKPLDQPLFDFDPTAPAAPDRISDPLGLFMRGLYPSQRVVVAVQRRVNSFQIVERLFERCGQRRGLTGRMAQHLQQPGG